MTTNRFAPIVQTMTDDALKIATAIYYTPGASLRDAAGNLRSETAAEAEFASAAKAEHRARWGY